MNKVSQFKFLFVAVLVHLLWFIAALNWKHIYNRDTFEYYYLFQNIISGNYYSGNPALPFEEIFMSIRTPLYSWFLQIIHTVVHNNFAVIFVQNILSIATCYYVFKVFTKYVDSAKQGLYWLFVLAHPAQLMAANMIVPEILLQVFLMLYFGNLVQYIYTGKRKLFLPMTLWLVLAMATKPVVYPVIVLHLLFAIWQAIKNKFVWHIAIALLPTLAVFAYGKWNEHRTGIYHISSVQPHNLINFWLQPFHSQQYGIEKARAINTEIKAEIAKEPDFASRYVKSSEIFKDSVLANIGSYAMYHGVKSVRYFIDPGKGELDLFTGYTKYSDLNNKNKKENFDLAFKQDGLSGVWSYLKSYPLLVVILFVVMMNVLRFAGAFIFIFQKKHLLLLKIVLLIWFGYFAVVSGPTSNYTRYIIPVLPILSICAAIGWGNILFIKNRRITAQ